MHEAKKFFAAFLICVEELSRIITEFDYCSNDLHRTLIVYGGNAIFQSLEILSSSHHM